MIEHIHFWVIPQKNGSLNPGESSALPHVLRPHSQQPGCSIHPTGKLIMKTWCVHVMEYYPEFKKKEIPSSVTT